MHLQIAIHSGCVCVRFHPLNWIWCLAIVCWLCHFNVTSEDKSFSGGFYRWVRYCWWKTSCTSWYVVYPIVHKVYVSQVVQDFFHQQYYFLWKGDVNSIFFDGFDQLRPVRQDCVQYQWGVECWSFQMFERQQLSQHWESWPTLHGSRFFCFNWVKRNQKPMSSKSSSEFPPFFSGLHGFGWIEDLGHLRLRAIGEQQFRTAVHQFGQRTTLG